MWLDRWGWQIPIGVHFIAFRVVTSPPAFFILVMPTPGRNMDIVAILASALDISSVAVNNALVEGQGRIMARWCEKACFGPYHMKMQVK